MDIGMHATETAARATLSGLVALWPIAVIAFAAASVLAGPHGLRALFGGRRAPPSWKAKATRRIFEASGGALSHAELVATRPYSPGDDDRDVDVPAPDFAWSAGIGVRSIGARGLAGLRDDLEDDSLAHIQASPVPVSMAGRLRRR